MVYKVSYLVLYQGLQQSWQFLRNLPVVGSRTDRALEELSTLSSTEKMYAKLLTSLEVIVKTW